MTEDEISLFDTLGDVTKEDWDAAYWLSLLADYSSKDPIKRLHFLCRRGYGASWERIQKLGIKTHVVAGGWDVKLGGLM